MQANGQLLGYIAHLNTLRPEHLTAMEDMLNRGYPTILSNYINNGHEHPHCDRETGKVVSTNRCLNITNPCTRYFILFSDYCDSLSLVELGIAISADVEIIALIGQKDLNNTFILADNITKYSCWENFITRRFFA